MIVTGNDHVRGAGTGQVELGHAGRERDRLAGSIPLLGRQRVQSPAAISRHIAIRTRLGMRMRALKDCVRSPLSGTRIPSRCQVWYSGCVIVISYVPGRLTAASSSTTESLYVADHPCQPLYTVSTYALSRPPHRGLLGRSGVVRGPRCRTGSDHKTLTRNALRCIQLPSGRAAFASRVASPNKDRTQSPIIHWMDCKDAPRIHVHNQYFPGLRGK